MTRTFGFFLIVSLSFVSFLADAKSVKLDWKPIPGAVAYQVRLQKDGVTLWTRQMTEPGWSGNLAPGAYDYQIRAIDEVRRPGIWSDFRSLVVMPPSPHAKMPADGNHFDFYNPNLSATLHWDAVPGAKSYILSLKNESGKTTRIAVNEEFFDLKKMPPGKYTWQVAAELAPGDRSPASLKKKKWESQPGPEAEVTIEYKELKAPQLEEPKGVLPPPREGVVQLHWRSVEGAVLYEARIIRVPPQSLGRSPAEEIESAKRFKTKETSASFRVSGEGRYVWGVRALANLNENHVPEAVGPESMGEFKFDRNAVFNQDLGYLSFSTMLTPYTYQLTSPSAGGSVSTNSLAAVFRLSGEYWFHSQWGVAVATDYVNFTLANQNFFRDNFEFFLKFRQQLSADKLGWSISPKVGFEVRDYTEITPVNNDGDAHEGFQGVGEWFAGPSVGLDIRKQFSEKFSFGFKMSYYVPLVILAGPASGAKLNSLAQFSNVSAGAQCLYWLSRNWGVGLGGFYDSRAIAYVLPNLSVPEQIHLDGAYFFGSIIYRFWK